MEDISLAAILATNRSVGVAPEVNLRECVTCMPPASANKALKPRGDVTRSPKQGHQWLHKKDLCPPKIILKKQNSKCIVTKVEIP